MTHSPSETRVTRHYIIQCISCDIRIPPDSRTCPKCGVPIAPGTVKIDVVIVPSPESAQATSQQPTTNSLFAPNASVVLRFLPLGQILSLPMHGPLILGRVYDADVGKALDLTEYGGEQHGISRQHCRLERCGSRLMITDLGSTNGTYLNGCRIVPHTEHPVAHGDRLILGTMHILVLFSTGQ